MLGDGIRKVKGQLEHNKAEIHAKDRLTEGLTTNFSPGGERPSILQSEGGGWSGEGMLNDKEMLAYGKIAGPRKLTFTIDNCKQESVKENMACLDRGRGRGGRGHQSQLSRSVPMISTPTVQRRGRKCIKTTVHASAHAYREEMAVDICQLIQEMEDSVMEEDSEPELEEWGDIVPDLGHTRGTMTLYRQALHVYWVMKHLLAKALEQVAGEMEEMAQGMPNIKKEMKSLQIIMIMQDSKLDEIQRSLMKLSPEPSVSLETPVIVDSDKDDRKEQSFQSLVLIFLWIAFSFHVFYVSLEHD